MEEAKILRELINDITDKPENLDNRIMQKIYRESELQKSLNESNKKWWSRVYLVTGIVIVSALIYSFTFIPIRNNSLVWIMVSGLAIPLITDSFLIHKAKQSRSNTFLS